MSRPENVVTTFYDRYRVDGFNGVPSREELEDFRTLLSDRLRAQLVAALEYRDKFIREHAAEPTSDGSPPSEEKPPFVDGSYFTSLFEGLTTFEVLRTAAAGDEWHVTVRFRYGDDRPTEWHDTIVVVREHGRFVIDDVIYGGAGEFNPTGRLSDQLSWRE